MNRAQHIVAILVEGRFDQSDLEQTASAALIEPDNFMDRITQKPPQIGRTWLEKNWHISDSTLGGFAIRFEKMYYGEHNYEIGYGFYTDMKYTQYRFCAPLPKDRRSMFLALKSLVTEIIPDLVQKIDHDRCNEREFRRIVHKTLEDGDNTRI